MRKDFLFIFVMLFTSCSHLSESLTGSRDLASKSKKSAQDYKNEYDKKITDIKLDYKEIEKIKSWLLTIENPNESVQKVENFKDVIDLIDINTKSMDVFDSRLGELKKLIKHTEYNSIFNYYIGVRMSLFSAYSEENFKFHEGEEYSQMVKVDPIGITYLDNEYEYRILKERVTSSSKEMIGLDQEQRRGFEAKNYFMVSDIHHDEKHLRFFYANADVMAAYYWVARSKQHLKYTLMQALSESVDNFLYEEEKKLISYYSKKKKMSLNQAMLDVFSMSDKELDQLLNALGPKIKQAYIDRASAFNKWVPMSLDHYSVTELNEILFSVIIEKQ